MNKITIQISPDWGLIQNNDQINKLTIYYIYLFMEYWGKMIKRVLYFKHGFKVLFKFNILAHVMVNGEGVVHEILDNEVSPRSFYFALRKSERMLSTYLHTYVDSGVEVNVIAFTFDFTII
jgi:hypothetical protein